MFKKLLSILFSTFLLVLFAIPQTPVHAEEPEPECWAIIVGVSRGEHIYGESGADNNAIDLSQRLRSILGEDHVKLLVDREATKANIKGALTEWVVDNADASDTVLFYFCGHCFLKQDKSGTLLYTPSTGYLAPYDAYYLTRLEGTWISESELNSWLDQSASERVVIILDIDSAGHFCHEFSGPGRILLGARYTEEHYITTSRANHTNGIFTYYLLEALDHFEDADANADYELSAEEIFQYAKAPILAWNADLSYSWLEWGMQHPVFISDCPEDSSLLTKVILDTNTSSSPFIKPFMVDNNRYRLKDLPLSFTWASGSAHSFDIPHDVDTGKGTKFVFSSWSDGARSTSRSISQGGKYTANYKARYQLTIESPYGNPKGEGWYDSGSIATVSVNPAEGIIIRRVFTSWSGDFTGDTAIASVTMNSPKAIRANWRTDYLQLYLLIATIIIAGAVITYILWKKK